MDGLLHNVCIESVDNGLALVRFTAFESHTDEVPTSYLVPEADPNGSCLRCVYLTYVGTDVYSWNAVDVCEWLTSSGKSHIMTTSPPSHDHLITPLSQGYCAHLAQTQQITIVVVLTESCRSSDLLQRLLFPC